VRILPYESSREEEGVEVCRRLRLAGLQAEADWVEETVKDFGEGARDGAREWRDLLEVLDEAQVEVRALEGQVEFLQKELKALRGG
jgi:hypothetical protein